MKKTILAASLLICLCFQGSCTLEASFESGGYRSKLAINAIGNNSDGSISTGGYLNIEIIGEDYDGISQIELRIPSINVDQTFFNQSDDTRWQINQTFTVDTIDFDAPRRIYVMLIDNDGSEYSRTISLRVNE
ncbi:hypothetical protein [uncultured Croceitalea sp.]|uniref:hypothetical protein n=1 Tax=uncultured Croceitalea sp. TaxID=1798908 RepID=UPI0033058F6C